MTFTVNTESLGQQKNETAHLRIFKTKILNGGQHATNTFGIRFLFILYCYQQHGTKIKQAPNKNQKPKIEFV